MQVTVLGAGSMGHGIAQVSARANNDVVLRDIEAEFVENGLEGSETTSRAASTGTRSARKKWRETLERIEGTTDLEEAVADADPRRRGGAEDMDLKQEVFATSKRRPTRTPSSPRTPPRCR